MKWLAVAVAVIVAAVVLYKINYPTYTYRYRMTVSVEVDGQVRSGSSVIEVPWECGPKIAGLGQCAASLRGQAAVIDLGSHGVVVATLINGESYGPAKDGAINAIWLCAQAFGNPSTDEKLPELPKLRGKRDLASSNLARFIWFSAPEDPATAVKLLVKDIPAIFGPSARFAGASVEITGDPIVIDIRVIYLPNKLGINRYLFIGDAS